MIELKGIIKLNTSIDCTYIQVASRWVGKGEASWVMLSLVHRFIHAN